MKRTLCSFTIFFYSLGASANPETFIAFGWGRGWGYKFENQAKQMALESAQEECHPYQAVQVSDWETERTNCVEGYCRGNAYARFTCEEKHQIPD